MNKRSKRTLLLLLLLSLVSISVANSQRFASAQLSQDSGSHWDGNWRMAMHNVFASGHNRREKHLSVNTIDQLEVKWVFDQDSANHEVGPIHATPVAVDNKVFVGSTWGRFYAIDQQGRLKWEFTTLPPNSLLENLLTGDDDQSSSLVGTPILGAAVLPQNYPYAIFGDQDGNIYARHRETGEKIWTQRRLNKHPLGGVVGNSLLLVNDMVIIGFASIESAAFEIQDSGVPYTCCTHRGMVVALDVATGDEKWRYETITRRENRRLPKALSPFERGPSGADIWGQPTYDPKSNTVYFGTGQHFSPDRTGGSTPTSDAIIALDASTGEEKWVTQTTEGDIWVRNITNPDPITGRFVDADFGDSPKIYRLRNGRRVIGAGQKDGTYHIFDALTGEILNQTKYLEPANSLGGFQQGGAFAKGRVFQHGLDRIGPITGNPLTQPFNGVVSALSPDGTEEFWRFEKFFSPLAGGLAIANGVIYLQSPIEETQPLVDPPQWAFYALDASTGEVLIRMPFDGRALSSPIVSQGRVYLGKGNSYLAELGIDEKGELICLGLPDDNDDDDDDD